MSTLIVRGPVRGGALTLPAGVTRLVYYPTNNRFDYNLSVRYAVAPDSENTLELFNEPKENDSFTPFGPGLFQYAVFLDSIKDTYTHTLPLGRSAGHNADFVDFAPFDSPYYDVFNPANARIGTLARRIRFPGGLAFDPPYDHTKKANKRENIDIQAVNISITHAKGVYPNYVPWPWRMSILPGTVDIAARRVQGPSRGARRYPRATDPSNIFTILDPAVRKNLKIGVEYVSVS